MAATKMQEVDKFSEECKLFSASGIDFYTGWRFSSWSKKQNVIWLCCKPLFFSALMIRIKSLLKVYLSHPATLQYFLRVQKYLPLSAL